ncbi:MAG: DUF3352 domain-containing protein [Chloroflexi bacterium]|nr:DUF3352 domain-containing protein [Chloroflexota bacterium]
MLKRLLAVLVLAALLLGLVPTLAASPTVELAALAQYFPGDTPLFGAVRTDDATIAELDRVLATVLAKLPEGVASPDLSLQSALDQIAREAGLDDFSGIRAWLGDYAAAGRLIEDDPSTSASEGVLFAAQITDRAAAEAFWKDILDRSGGQDYRVEAADAFTLYAIESDPPMDAGLLFTDDVMLLGVANLRQLLLTREAKLAQNATFQQTLDLLPAEQYAGLLYFDAAALAEFSQGSPGLTSTLLGQQAVGFTLLDERSLVMDVASRLGNLSALENLGLSLPSLQPVSPAFAAHVPADVSLLAHATNVKALYDAFIETARATAEREGTSAEEFERGLNQLAFAVRGFTGLDLEDDILSWMTGDFALFVSLDAQAITDAVLQGMNGDTPRLEELPVSAGLVIEATDPAKAQALAAGIARALPQLAAQDENVTISQEQIGGVDVTVISAPVELQADFRVPLDIIIGANDAVFVIATRDSATAILEGQPGFDSTPQFAEVTRTLGNAPTSVWYISGEGFGLVTGFTTLALLGPSINNVFDEIVAGLEGSATLTPEQLQQRQDEQRRQQMEQARQAQAFMQLLTGLVSTGTISTYNVEGGAVTRFVLTLAE